jgi:hypothetical protein
MTKLYLLGFCCFVLFTTAVSLVRPTEGPKPAFERPTLNPKPPEGDCVTSLAVSPAWRLCRRPCFNFWKGKTIPLRFLLLRFIDYRGFTRKALRRPKTCPGGARLYKEEDPSFVFLDMELDLFLSDLTIILGAKKFNEFSHLIHQHGEKIQQNSQSNSIKC